MNCKNCKKPMWVEGIIYDKINLCHLCYVELGGVNAD